MTPRERQLLLAAGFEVHHDTAFDDSGKDVPTPLALLTAEATLKRHQSESILFFDTETSGTDPWKNQVLELAALRCVRPNYRIVETLELRVRLRHGGRIDRGALEVNGLNPYAKDWAASAVTSREAVEAFAAIAHRSGVIVGHNIGFDLRFMDAEAAAAKAYLESMWHTKLIYDTMDLAKRWLVKPAEVANHKLSTLCEWFGIPNDGQHRAMVDVQRTLAVYRALRDLERECVVRRRPKLTCFDIETPEERAASTLLKYPEHESYPVDVEGFLPKCALCGNVLARCGHSTSHKRDAA